MKCACGQELPVKLQDHLMDGYLVNCRDYWQERAEAAEARAHQVKTWHELQVTLLENRLHDSETRAAALQRAGERLADAISRMLATVPAGEYLRYFLRHRLDAWDVALAKGKAECVACGRPASGQRRCESCQKQHPVCDQHRGEGEAGAVGDAAKDGSWGRLPATEE